MAQQFKPGDKVRMAASIFTIPQGTTGVVKAFHKAAADPYDRDTVSVDFDNGESRTLSAVHFELVLAAWERELLEPAAPTDPFAATRLPHPEIDVDDVVRAEKGSEVYQGRTRAGRGGGHSVVATKGADLYIGAFGGSTVGSLAARGFEVTVIEKAPPHEPPAPEPKPLPTEVGFYVAADEADEESVFHATVYRFDDDGDWSTGSTFGDSTAENFDAKKAQAQRAHDRVGLVRLVPETAKPAERYVFRRGLRSYSARTGAYDTETGEFAPMLRPENIDRLNSGEDPRSKWAWAPASEYRGFEEVTA